MALAQLAQARTESVQAATPEFIEPLVEVM